MLVGTRSAANDLAGEVRHFQFLKGKYRVLLFVDEYYRKAR